MAKKTKLTVYGAVPGESTMYETTDEKMFVVDEIVSNPMVVRKLVDKYTKNPLLSTETIQVYPVDEESKKPVSYYSEAVPRPGHKFMLVGGNSALQFYAITRYNNSIGVNTNKLKAIQFVVIDLKSHKEKPQEFAIIKANQVSKKAGLAELTRYYSVNGSANPKSQIEYNYLHQDAETSSHAFFGTRNYTDATVNFILAVQGIWNSTERKEFKEGNFSSYNHSFAADLPNIINFLISLQNNSRGRWKITNARAKNFAKFYHESVQLKKKAVDLNRVINFIVKNPNLAFGKACTNCNQLINGYVDRIDEIGKQGSTETWEKVYTDMSHEPNF